VQKWLWAEYVKSGRPQVDHNHSRAMLKRNGNKTSPTYTYITSVTGVLPVSFWSD